MSYAEKWSHLDNEINHIRSANYKKHARDAKILSV